MGTPFTEPTDRACAICGRGTDEASIAVITEVREGARAGDRAWLCEGCGQDRQRCRLFARLSHDWYTYLTTEGLFGSPDRPMPVVSTRISSPRLLATADPRDSQPLTRYHAWTFDI